MTSTRSLAKARWILPLVALAALLQLVGRVSSQVPSNAQGTRPRRIAVFGSSVAFGVGDESGKEGATGILRAMLAPKGWEVLNQSRGGDTTQLLATRWSPEGAPNPNTRYLTTVNPGYVVIGLSLANEGISEAQSRQQKDAVFQQYADGIKGFIAKARQQNIVPIVTLCYPRSVYTPVEYEYIRRMNILMNSWDVPTVNFLGAADDGTGRWAKGFMFNDKHPNVAGHRELATTYVPSLFEALEKGKPTPTRASGEQGVARISGGAAPLSFEPESTMHPFTISMMVRTQGDGTVAAISGSTLQANTASKSFGSGPGAVQFDETTLTADQPFTATIGVQNGQWTYQSAAGATVSSNDAAVTSSNATSAAPSGSSAPISNAGWHHIVLSHYTARGITFFYVDGKLAGSVNERLEPKRFVIGGPGTGEHAGAQEAASQTGTPRDAAAPKQTDLRDVFLFRAALNADEVAVLNQGKMLQSSLEIYSPLDDAEFHPNSVAENKAQSLTGWKIGSDRVLQVGDDVKH